MWKALCGFYSSRRARAFAQPPGVRSRGHQAEQANAGGSGWHTRHRHDRPDRPDVEGSDLFAYQVKDFQVSGGPKWINEDRFDVNAKSRGAGEGRAALTDVADPPGRPVPTRLPSRTEGGPAYALVVAKSGLKIKPSKQRPDRDPRAATAGITATGVTMAKLADQLSRRVGAPVVDLTETTGGYDFKLEWSIDGDPRTTRSPQCSTPFIAARSEGRIAQAPARPDRR